MARSFKLPPAESPYEQAMTGVLQDITTPGAGPTAKRPRVSLQTGLAYFDTTLGRPIWWNGTAWIEADGTVV